MHPGKSFTFVKHYFTQKYQFKKYKECLESLKIGECILLQDFSRNKDIGYQDEIKSAYWTNKQVSVHPTVIFFRTTKGGNPKKIVITHLSDVTNHDVHIVT